MSATLTINNFSSPNILETGALDADATASASPVTLTVQNNQNISANDYIIIGALGTEQSELKQVTSITGTNQITVPSLANKHLRFSAVTKLFGNQITIYRAPNTNGLQPVDANYAVFSGSVVSLDTDQASTLFVDPAGSSDYWYKFVYTNSTTASSTSLADSSSARGQSYSNYCSVDDIRGEAGFTRSPYITDAMIDAKRQAAQDEVNSALGGFYQVPFSTPINAFIADITQRLAAGLLLLEQFGSFQTMDTQNGKSKVDGARADIQKIQSGTYVLKDETGSSIAVTGAGGFNAWPNGTTETTDSSAHGDYGPLTSITDRY